jgi:shikimate dehydrogenase
MTLRLGRDTRLCLSISARPSNFGTRFHNHLYEELGLDFVYKAFAVTDLPGAIAGVRALSVRGVGVSMPFKEAVIAHVDAMAPSAAAIGAVNTLVNEDGFLAAHNTDYVAAARLVAAQGLDPATPVVVRGSGGMAKAVAAALCDAGFANGTVVARNPETGRALAARCGWSWRGDLVAAEGAMLVNVTPIGMAGGPEADDLAFPEAAIAAAALVFDAVALPLETPTIRAARAHGRRIVSGGEVAVLQAVEQFVLYTGVRPSEAAIARAAAFARAGTR